MQKQRRIDRLRFGLLLVLMALPLDRSWSQDGTTLYKIEDIDPKATPSFFTPQLLRFLHFSDWPNTPIEAIRTPDHPHTIGMLKKTVIPVPLAAVVTLTEQFEAYPKIWEDLLESKILSRDRNRTYVEITRKRPTFFMPKINFQMVYVSDKSQAGHVVYRQQLIKGNQVKTSDSLVILDQVSDTQTSIKVVNFFDPDLGLLNSIAPSKIWSESLKAGISDDQAFRLKLEHPDWSVEQISEEAKKSTKNFRADQIPSVNLSQIQLN